jgi:hypothetical protein
MRKKELGEDRNLMLCELKQNALIPLYIFQLQREKKSQVDFMCGTVIESCLRFSSENRYCLIKLNVSMFTACNIDFYTLFKLYSLKNLIHET